MQKQAFNINFSQGLDTKTDPFQIAPGKFLGLTNSVFTKNKLLGKRNGFGKLTSLPDTSTSSVTTFNGNLLAIGNKVQAFSQESNSWIPSGAIQPLQMSTMPLVSYSSGQTTVDTAISSNGLALSTWLDVNGFSYYQINDSSTGQIVVPKTQLVATATMSRAFALGNYLIVTYIATISSATHLQRIAIPIGNPTASVSPVDLSTQVKNLTAGYDGYVADNHLYLAFNGSDGGGAIRVLSINQYLNTGSVKIITGKNGDLISVCADTSGPTIVWVSFYDSGTNNTYSTAYDANLLVVLAPVLTKVGDVLKELVSYAVSGVLTLAYEIYNTYTYSPNARTDMVKTKTVTQAGTVGTEVLVAKGIGIFSKLFQYNGGTYFLATYGQAYQPTYFLMNLSGNIIAKLAYSNGGGYAVNQVVPGVNINGSTIQIGYLYRNQLQSVNKSQGVSNVAGIYAQTGINLATFSFSNLSNTQEIGKNLNITGGILWAYDGSKVTEQGFNVWPEDLAATSASTGGAMTAQQYYYVATYEWTDSQGNLFRSAPSVPLGITLSGPSTQVVTVNVPTLRLTYKVSPNPVRIVLYRWSAAQQNYYQVTSINSPVLNDPSVDSVAIADGLADSAILGNVLLYTTGGVVENIGAPSFIDVGLFDSRIFGIDSEDPNLLWYSKQVIESTPVEFSDLFTIYVAPTTGAQGSTGPSFCVASMDSNLILFKKDAIYYIAGTGPDNTGANSGYSQPTFITSTVGCANKRSIVMTPQGLMFQSDKGIWLLERNMQTTYIGAAVEKYNSNTIESALVIPGTNQVRFTLDNGVTLMFDYYYQQWGTFTNIPAISSTLYQSLHTYVDQYGAVYQETPGKYLDGSNPVLMSFQTGWLNLAGLQGYQRAYYFLMLAEFYSPHKVQIQVAYDYAPAPSQQSLIVPTNYTPAWGGDATWGSGSPWGGTSQLEQWRVFFQNQKCQAFQIYFNEIYDSTYGQPAGVGLTVSGLDMVVGMKKGYVPVFARNSVG